MVFVRKIGDLYSAATFNAPADGSPPPGEVKEPVVAAVTPPPADPPKDPTPAVTPEPKKEETPPVTPRNPLALAPEPNKEETPPPAPEKKDGEQWPEAGFPDNWRDRMLVGVEDKDGTLAKALKDAASPAELPKALMERDSKIKAMDERLKKAVVIPGEGASKEDIQAFRKALGVPEKAEEYKFFRPDAVKPDTPEAEESKRLEAEFAPIMLQAGINQGQVDEIVKGFYTVQNKQQAARDANAVAVAKKTESDLKAEMGKDYEPNLEMALRAMNYYMKDETANFLDLQLADGTRLGDNANITRGLVRMGREWSNGVEMIDGKPTTGIDVQGEYNKMMEKVGSPEYERPDFQKRLIDLKNVLNRRQGITG
jgi:hypothetical protein